MQRTGILTDPLDPADDRHALLSIILVGDQIDDYALPVDGDFPRANAAQYRQFWQRPWLGILDRPSLSGHRGDVRAAAVDVDDGAVDEGGLIAGKVDGGRG
jgi:hypothetical protein